jgi:hypothetical protein
MNTDTPKFVSTPLWSLISGGREPKPAKVTPLVEPAGPAKFSASEEIERAVKDKDIPRFNWLTATWMPQDPLKKYEARKNAKESGLELKVTFKGYSRT